MSLYPATGNQCSLITSSSIFHWVTNGNHPIHRASITTNACTNGLIHFSKKRFTPASFREETGLEKNSKKRISYVVSNALFEFK